VITFRPLDLAADLSAFSLLDTSFTTNRIYLLEQSTHNCKLVETPVSPPLQKHYSHFDLTMLDWGLVATRDSEILGMVALRFESWNRRAIIQHLYVATPVRNSGIGRALVEAAAIEAQRRSARVLWAETQSVNFGAVQFYERLGFVWCGFDTALYDPAVVPGHETALFFVRSLAETPD
jgi:ribosomal protein S18 acetylase RimI-like enzyme